MTYRVYYWCPIIGANDTVSSGLSIKEAEKEVDKFNHMKQFDGTKAGCCNYYLEPEGD